MEIECHLRAFFSRQHLGLKKSIAKEPHQLKNTCEGATSASLTPPSDMIMVVNITLDMKNQVNNTQSYFLNS